MLLVFNNINVFANSFELRKIEKMINTIIFLASRRIEA